jgi:uncharacterized membrane protein
MNPFGVNSSIETVLSISVAVIVLASVLLAVLYSLWGGFLLITSGGNEEKVKPAVNHIRHAFLGLIVLVLILFIAPKILEIFGLPYGESLRPSNIFSEIQSVSQKIFGGSSSSDQYEDIQTEKSIDDVL